MANYFIEFRIMGQMRHEVKAITDDVRRNFHIRGSRPVPHISIVYNPTPYNSTRQNERRLIHDFISICSQYRIIELQFDGFGEFINNDDNNAAIIKVKPFEELYKLRWDLICSLRNYCKLDPEYDSKQNYYKPHIALAYKLDRNKLKGVMTYLSRRGQPYGHHYMARATLLKNGKILREYDFFLRQELTRMQALNPIIKSQTYAMIRKQINKKKRTRTINKLIRFITYPFRLLKKP